MSTAATPPTAPTTWNLDPTHSSAEFKVKHMMISNVKGHFSKLSGTLTLDEADLAKSQIEASIDAASLETRDAQRDGHLKSADFFDVEKFPTITFKSTSIQVTGEDELAVSGDLTIRDVTHPVVFSVEGPDTGHQGSLGQSAGRGVGNHKDQPQRVRLDVERCAGRRRHPGGR